MRREYDQIFTRKLCPKCKGARLNEAALGSKLKGKNIAELSAMQVSDLAPFIRGVKAKEVQPMLDALAARLENLVTIGLGYLSLDRESSSLSGGESQRVKMVRHLGSSLTDITYVFDEPSVGLHPHDVGRLAGLMQQLRDKGNTVLVVEHKPRDDGDRRPRRRHGAARRHARAARSSTRATIAGLLKSGTLTGNHINKHQPIKDDAAQARRQARDQARQAQQPEGRLGLDPARRADGGHRRRRLGQDRR